MRSRRPSLEECRAALNSAAGRELADDDFEAIMERVQARTQRRMAAGETPDQAARGAAADEAADARLAATIEQSRRMIMMTRIVPGLKLRAIAGDEWNSVMAAMGGSARKGRMYGLSADATGKTLRDQHSGDLINELRRGDLWDAVQRARKDPLLDRQIAEEKWWLDTPDARPAGQPVNALARRIAEILHKHQETMRLSLNQAGAWIGKLEHYVVRQSHDMWKILGNPRDPEGSFRAWRDHIWPRLDPKTFDHIVEGTDLTEGIPSSYNRFLRETWNSLSTGLHETGMGGDWLGGFKGPGNIAKRLSQERVLHFKDPVAWHEYNAKFGRGTVFDSVLQGIEHGAKNVAIMRIFGPNPKATIHTWTDQLAQQAKARNDAAMVRRLGNQNEIDKIIDQMTGAANQPANMTFAWHMATVRNWQNITRLAGAVLSSFSDFASNTAMLRHHGVSMPQAWAQMFNELLPTTREAQKQFAIELGGWLSGVRGEIAARLRAEDSPYGGLSRTTDMYFKWNGLNWWTESFRVADAKLLTARYASYANRTFEQLPQIVRTSLDRYGIGAGEWAALRKVPGRAVDGERYLMAGDIRTLPDEAVAHLGGNADRARADLQSRYGTLLNDSISEGLSEPTIRTRAMMTAGYAPGTPQGEALRSVGQFKSFVGNFMVRTLGRELLRGETPMLGGRLHVDLGGIVNLMVWTTVFGAFSIMAKDLVAGRKLREITDTAAALKFAAAALVQGGGLGIYGDFLFGGASGPIRSFAETLVGPTIGTLGDVKRMLDEIETGEGNLLSSAVRFGKSNLPFNVFYTKLALDYLFFHGLQEKVNPGYLHRMERKSQREYNQTYWLRPTEAVRF